MKSRYLKLVSLFTAGVIMTATPVEVLADTAVTAGITETITSNLETESKLVAER